MPGKKLGVIALSLVVVLAAAAGSTWWASTAVPEFYEQALVDEPLPEIRQQAARQFVEQTLQLVEEIRQSEEWSEEFTQTQVNSWLAQHLHRYDKYVPKGVSDPRVQFVQGLLQVGFHFTSKNWDGVVSLDLRPSVPEPNQLQIEIESVRAGLLPLPLEEFKLRISKEFAKEGFAAEWQDRDGREALIVNLDRGQETAPVLETVEVIEGAIRIAGSRDTDPSSDARTPDADPYRVALRGQSNSKPNVQ